jgi:hypothetical protein
VLTEIDYFLRDEREAMRIYARPILTTGKRTAPLDCLVEVVTV